MFLTVKQVAEWLNIKPSTLYLWVAREKIPCRKIHGLIRFERDAILRWLDSFATGRSKRVPLLHEHTTSTSVDDLIARAKGEVYTPRHGETISPSPLRKEEEDGAR